jgi:hemerythrin-like metal-binding protein
MWFSKPKPSPEEPFFPWSDPDHSVGVQRFDQEHRHLAGLVSKVHTALLKQHDRGLADKLMENLIQETRTHFAHEERVLEETGYPGREEHCAEHAALLREAQDLLRQFHSGGLAAVALPIFLKKWLVPHIQGSDRKYAATLRRQGVR